MVLIMGNPFTLLLLGCLFVWYSCSKFQLTKSSNNFTDQSALIAFKSGISFSPNETLLATNWSTKPNSICNWIGVSCSRRRQRVTALDLSCMGLKGTISPHIVKVLRLQLLGAFKSFDAECEVLRTIRHRNLVKVITSCTNPEFRALVLEYMSNGTLERWLYSHNYCLHLVQRVNIMVDVASALYYLHHSQSESILHCDLKPTNILLNEDMVAHVGDFGIAKILVKNKDATHTKTLGTIGYIAPEYGCEGMVSTKSDVYSFGIVLLEMITRKKPTDDMFAGDFTLRQLVNASIPDRIMEVVDEGLLRIEDGRDTIALQTILSSIMNLGLRCSEELPETRMDIKDVLVKLNKIKSTFFENRNRVPRHT